MVKKTAKAKRLQDAEELLMPLNAYILYVSIRNYRLYRRG